MTVTRVVHRALLFRTVTMAWAGLFLERGEHDSLCRESSSLIITLHGGAELGAARTDTKNPARSRFLGGYRRDQAAFSA